MKMNLTKKKVLGGALATAVAITLFTGYTARRADATESSREAMKTKAASIPDKVQTVAGELQFFDGVPIGDTNDRVYDYLTRSRALGVYLDNVGAVSIYSVLAGMAEQGADAPNKIAIWEQLMDSRTPVITSNTSTMYAYAPTDLAKDGPTVIEIPPGMLGFLDDAWQRFVGNMGVTGPDKGKGGKYLVIPPGYEGEIPDGYFLLKPLTNRNFLFLRGSIKDGLEAAVENFKSGLKVYPLKDAANPAPTELVNMSGRSFSTIFPSTLEYFEILNNIVQAEPIEAVGPEVRGYMASIGIVKGQPFNPDERMKKLLTEAALLGNAAGRSITYDPRIDGVKFYPDSKSQWVTAYANQEHFVRSGRNHESRCASIVLLQRRWCDTRDGDDPCGRRLRLCIGVSRSEQPALRRFENLQAAPAAKCAGQQLLGGHALRHPDPLPAPDQPAIPHRRQSD